MFTILITVQEKSFPKFYEESVLIILFYVFYIQVTANIEESNICFMYSTYLWDMSAMVVYMQGHFNHLCQENKAYLNMSW